MPIPNFHGVPTVVTGGAGFIGSHLVDALVERGAEVTVLDDLSSGFERNLEHVLHRIRFLKGDIRDPDACKEAVDGSKYVFHQAARGSVPRSIVDPGSTIGVNVAGTANVFSACRNANVQRVVYASSSSVYGDSMTLPKREGEEGRPLSPYALSKTMNEELASLFGRSFGMTLIGLRYFNVYGPAQNPNGGYAAVVPRFIRALMEGRALTIDGDGSQTRDFTFVSDVVGANLAAAGADLLSSPLLFNVCRGGQTSIRELAELIHRLVGVHTSTEYKSRREADIPHSSGDPSLAKQMLDWTAGTPLESGLSATIAWYARNLRS